MAIISTRDTHIFERDIADHYVEPSWVSSRLFDVEQFDGPILDPCCGWGRILQAADQAGYTVMGSDIVDRGCGVDGFRVEDFLCANHTEWLAQAGAIVTNPPFDRIEDCAAKALALMNLPDSRIAKVAFVFPVRRLPAAHWLRATPLRRIWFLTPRPSMPTSGTAARLVAAPRISRG
jgi:hypothetical protein